VLARAFPFLATVILLFPMGVFMLASPPLLVLKHDTPLDGRFIRGLFNIYYVSVMVVATAGALGCILVGKTGAAAAMGGLVLVVFGIRRWMIVKMDDLREAIARGESGAIPGFRRLHLAGMALNICQLAGVAWGMTRLAT